MNDLERSRPLAWCLLVAFVFITLYQLGVRTLLPPDEGRYATMAREMFASGDWITTRLNGIKYFEKPPLQTWMSALSFSLFGIGEWQARLWTGLNGIFGVLLTAYTGRRLFGAQAGLYAALVLASCAYWIAAGQMASLDMGLAGMMTLTLCALLLAQRDDATPRERRNWMLVCWAGMALAVLSKGLVGIVLPGAVLVLYTLVTRDWSLWTRLHSGQGVLLFLAIAAPWFVLVALRNPEQPYFFFVHEHFNRYLTPGHRREAAWWTFLALLAGGSIPWLGVLVQSLLAGTRRAPGRLKPRLLLLLWVVLIIGFFSASSSKLPGYIVPVFPALALLVATWFETGTRGSRTAAGLLTAAFGVALMGIAPFVTGFSRWAGEEALYAAWQPYVLAAGFISAVGGALAMLYARQMQRDLTVLVLAISGFATAHLMLAGFDAVGKGRAGVNLLPAIRAEIRADTKIYAVGLYDQSLTFYLGRPVTLVAIWDEFTFGLQQQPELSVPTVAAFHARWRADAAAGVPNLAIVRADIATAMRRLGLPVRVVAADSRRTVIANDRAP
jgi:4-amino-4-deoxy-L-arabinose transferase-like glycosyltransferase